MDEQNGVSILFLWEDVGAVLEVERGEVLGSEQRPVVLVGRRQHRREQGAGARPGDHVEVVGDPSIWAVQLLQVKYSNHITCSQSKLVLLHRPVTST